MNIVLTYFFLGEIAQATRYSGSVDIQGTVYIAGALKINTELSAYGEINIQEDSALVLSGIL